MIKDKRFLSAVLAAALLLTIFAAPAAAAGSPLLGKLRITELMVKNRTTLRDEDGDFPDWIELANVSDETLDLTGCRVADREGRRGWMIPGGHLEPGERLVIFASKKNRTGNTLHTDFALSEKDCVCLYDALGWPLDRIACEDWETDSGIIFPERSWDSLIRKGRHRGGRNFARKIFMTRLWRKNRMKGH